MNVFSGRIDHAPESKLVPTFAREERVEWGQNGAHLACRPPGFHRMTTGSPSAQLGWLMAATRGHNSTRRPAEREKKGANGAGDGKRARNVGRSGEGRYSGGGPGERGPEKEKEVPLDMALNIDFYEEKSSRVAGVVGVKPRCARLSSGGEAVRVGAVRGGGGPGWGVHGRVIRGVWRRGSGKGGPGKGGPQQGFLAEKTWPSATELAQKQLAWPEKLLV